MTHRESAGETNNENGDGNLANGYFEKILDGVRAGSESEMQLLVEFAIDQVRTACQRRFDRFQIRGIIGSEDIVNNVFQHFFDRVKRDTLPGVSDLLTFEKWVHLEVCQRTARAFRAYRINRSHFRREADAKRDGNTSSLMAAVDPVSDVDDVDEREHLQRSVQCLPEELQAIVKLHLVGTSNREISQRLALSTKTVSRKLKIVRETWRSQET